MTDGVDPQILALLGGDKTSLLGGNAGKNAGNVGDPDAFSRILDQQRVTDANPASNPSDGGSSLPPGGREAAAGGDSAAQPGPTEGRGDAATAGESDGTVAAAAGNVAAGQARSKRSDSGAAGDPTARPAASSDAAKARVVATPELGRPALSIEGLPGAQLERSGPVPGPGGATSAAQALTPPTDSKAELNAAAVSERAKLRAPGLTPGAQPVDEEASGARPAPRGVATASAAPAGPYGIAPSTTGPATSEARLAKAVRAPLSQVSVPAATEAEPARVGIDGQNRRGEPRLGDGTPAASRPADATALAKLASADGATDPLQQPASKDATAPKTPPDIAAVQSQLRRSQTATASSGSAPATDGSSAEDPAVDAPRGVLFASEDASASAGRRPGSADGAGTGVQINPRAAAQPGGDTLSVRGTELGPEARPTVDVAAGPAGEATAGGASRVTDAALPSAPTATTGPAIAINSPNAPGTTSGVERMPEFSLSRPPEDPEFAGELTTRMKVLVRDGVREARINLHPAELGRLQVTVSTEGDQARISFMAETSAARDAIEQSLPRLRDMLEQNGLQLAQSDVGQQGLAQGRRDDGGEAGPLAATGSGAGDDEAQDGPDSRASVSGSSRIDTYI
ncbi:MAG: flagellar hook-length control protein FliK [Pseudomonadota bacterium]